MGMYDEIRCDAPLPDGGGSGNIWFQTKSFPSPCLQRYVITQGGRLVDSVGHDLEAEGYLVFYGNVETAAAHSPDQARREYRARFLAGQLQSIARVDEKDCRVYYGLASFRYFDAPTFMFGDPREDQCRG